MLPIWLLCTLAGLIRFAKAVPCSDIGWPTLDRKTGQTVAPKYPDPFKQGQGWDIIKAQDCWVRFQTPGDKFHGSGSLNPFDARVTTTRWTATGEQVTSTMKHYTGSPTNIMLWQRMSGWALLYAGIITDPDVSFNRQERLNEYNTVISLCKSSLATKNLPSIELMGFSAALRHAQADSSRTIGEGRKYGTGECMGSKGAGISSRLCIYNDTSSILGRQS
jgi:hypothetical protein